MQIHELIFPFTRSGRNFALKYNVRDPNLKKYVTVYTQYEKEGWNIDKFKEVYSMYGKIKGVPANIDSFNKYGILD